MALRGKYDLGGSAYVKTMDEKASDYSLLIRRAERLLADNNGKPSTEEAELYYKAAKKCEEIMALNLSSRQVHSQWATRREDCERRIREITAALVPAPEPKPEPPAKPVAVSKQAVDGTSRTKAEEKGKNTAGFKTKNANADVSAETILSWYQESPAEGLDNVIGMEPLKQRLINEAASVGWDLIDKDLKISPVQSYFLYGPPGTGKTTFINAFAKEMMDQGFKYIKLTGSDIHNSLVGVAEKIVTAAFAEAIDNAPCVIFIDEVEGVCASRSSSTTASHEKRLTNAFLEARNKMNASNQRVIFFGATNHPADVDPAMLDSVKLVYIPLPDQEARANFFVKNLGKIKPEDGFGYEEMAAATEGSSFRELKQLISTITASLKHDLIEQYKVTDEEGKLDQAKTDQIAHEALDAGQVFLRKSAFEQKLRDNPPKDKKVVMDEMKAFEGSMSALG